MSHLYVAVEDALSEAVCRRLVFDIVGAEVEVTVLRRNGYGYLKSKISNFAQMSNHHLVLLLTDLDTHQCAPLLIRDWWGIGRPLPERLMFRVAVREVEAWLLADTLGMARFLGVHEQSLPKQVEELADPKAELLRAASRGNREIRRDIVAARGASASQGLGYNTTLSYFVSEKWNSEDASENSPSLKRACSRLSELKKHLIN